MKKNLSPTRTILITSIASLLALHEGYAGEGVLSSGGFTSDATTGISTSKTYVALGNIVGGDVTVNGATFLGTGLSGTGWALSNVGNEFGSGGNQTTTFGGQAITGLFNGFQYNGTPGVMTFSGLTAGQTYVGTLYNEAWGLGADRTQHIRTSDGATLIYNEDALEASALRYTFVATGATATVNFLAKIPGNTMHFYGVSNERVFNNAWTASIDNTWNEPANWASGVVPNAAGRSATLSPQVSATTVTLGGATTAGHLEFQGTGAYTLLGIDPFTFQADAGGVSVLKADAGSHTISAPISLNSDLTKFGAGTVTVAGLSGGAKALSVNGGTLRFAGSNSYTGGTSIGSGATLDLNATSQSLGTLNGAGTLVNNTAGTSVATVDSGTFAGALNNGAGTLALAKSTSGSLTLSGTSSYTGATTVNAGTLKLTAGSNAMITDNFATSLNPNTADLNFNLANRQTGSAALQNWTPAGNTQTGNTTGVQQADGTAGEYLLLAFGASATLSGMPLSSSNVSGPLRINFDMFKGNSGDASEWTSFTMRSTPNQGFPIAGSGEFGMLYRRNTGIQVFSNGGLIQDAGSTSGGDNFGFYLADAAGSGSPFAGNGTRLIITQGGSIFGSHLLNTGMGTRYLTFGSAGGMIGGVDNLAVNPFQTNTLASSTDLSLTIAGATLALDAVNQTVASLNGVGGTAVNMGPFSKLTVSGAGSSDFSGTINGAFARLEKGGTGNLSLNSANTYTGGTTISGGAIFAHNTNALGTGAVSIGAGGNYLPWFNVGSPIISHNFTLNGLGGNPGDGNKAAIYADGGGGGFSEYLLTGSVTLAATSDISGHNTNNLRAIGQITGPGGLTKGSGRGDENNALILNNTGNDYAGNTVVANGTLKLGASEVIPHGAGKGALVVNSGATFDLAGNSETINNLSGAGTVTATPGIAIAAPTFFTTNAGSGVSTGKTYTHRLDFGDGAGATVNGVAFDSAANSGANWSLAGAAALLPEGVGAASTPTFADGANGTGMNLLLSDFYYNGNPATLTLNGLTPGTTYETHLYQRQWGGDRTQLFSFAAGSAVGVLLHDQDATATPSYLSFRFTADGSGTATLNTTQVGAGTYHWYGLTNEVVATPAAPTLTVGDANDSTFSGNIIGALALTKQGNGKLVLSSTNSYSGPTTLNGGTLLVNGSLDSTSSVAVNAGTLGGNGSINSAATITIATGAIVAPGASIGTLSTGSVAFADGSALSIEIGVTTADQLAITGGGSIAGTVNLSLTLLDNPLDDTTFTLLDGTTPFSGYSGGARFSYSGNSLDEGELFTVTTGGYTQEFSISYAADSGKDVTVHATPEPTSAALLLLGGAALLRRRRRHE